WPKISQIVMEIHDRTGESVKRVEELLSGKGYRCAVEHEKMLEHSGLSNLYATRGDANDEIRSDSGKCRTRQKASSLKRNTQDFCTALRSFMNRAAPPLILCVSPRTPAAESDA